MLPPCHQSLYRARVAWSTWEDQVYIQAPSSLIFSNCSGPDDGSCNGPEEGDCWASDTLLFLSFATDDSVCCEVLACRLAVAGEWDCKSAVPYAKGAVTGRGSGVLRCASLSPI